MQKVDRQGIRPAVPIADRASMRDRFWEKIWEMIRVWTWWTLLGADSTNPGAAGSLNVVKRSVPSTTPTAEESALGDEERAERLRSLADRVFDPDGLDRVTLERIEQLTDDPR